MRCFNISYKKLRKTHITIINWLFEGIMRTQSRLNYNKLILHDFQTTQNRDSKLNYVSDLEIVMYNDKERKVGFPHYVYSFLKGK